jgi:uncharacterized protein (TIGR04255 family)
MIIMKIQRHYKRAPITEALIDLRVTPSEDVSLDALRTIRVGYEEAYPHEKRNIVGQVTFTSDGELNPVSTNQQIGFVYANQDESRLVQVRLDGFTFNQLAPYPTWKEFRDEAKTWWERYYTVVQPKAINRLAVRYINKLEIPFISAELNEYIKTYPWVSDQLPQNSVSGYFMQLRIPQPDIRAMLVLSEALEGTPDQQSVAIILDIDLFCDDHIPNGEQAIWDYFEELRHRKNLIFESSITDAMRELLNQ